MLSYLFLHYFRYFLKLHKMGMQILGPHVEHLSLKNSNLLEGTLIEILQLCPNLKVGNFMLSFNRIKCFDIVS